jgi:hypothetical protein
MERILEDPGMAGEQFDASSDPPGGDSRTRSRGTRPYLGVQFQCCRTYARIYPNTAGTAFIGHCPRCGKRVEFLISDSGDEGRFFTVY